MTDHRKEIPTLEDRLRSRFEWGLITDITPPDLETRIAILRKKAKADGLDIPNEVMLYIANQIDSNIRELEGALIRVVAYSSLVNKDITAGLAAEALKDIIPSSKSQVITISGIQEAVGEYFHVRLEDFKAKNGRKVSHSRAKSLCIFQESLQMPHYQKSVMNLVVEIIQPSSMHMKKYRNY